MAIKEKLNTYDKWSLPELEIKRFDKKTYLLYNHLTKKSFVVDNFVVDTLLQFLRYEPLEKIRAFVQSQGYSFDHILNFFTENKFILFNQQAKKQRYLKLSLNFIPKQIMKPMILLLLFIYVFTILKSLHILVKQPLHSYELYPVHGFLYLIVFYFSWLVLAFFHELAHVLVASYFSCEIKVYFKIYFIFPALVTEVPRAVILNKFRRIAIHSAGMIMDAFLIGLFVILAHYFPHHYKLFRFFALIKVLSLFSQLKLFLKTDLYFVLEDILGTINLKHEALEFLKGKRQGFLNKKRAIILFLIFVIVGYSTNIFVILTYVLPGLFEFYNHNAESRLVVISFLLITLFYYLFRFIKSKVVKQVSH